MNLVKNVLVSLSILSFLLIGSGTAFSENIQVPVSTPVIEKAQVPVKSGIVDKSIQYIKNRNINSVDHTAITLDNPQTVEFKHFTEELSYNLDWAANKTDGNWSYHSRDYLMQNLFQSKTTIGLPSMPFLFKNTDFSVISGYGFYDDKAIDYNSGAVIPLKLEPRWNFLNIPKWQLSAALISDFIIPTGHTYPGNDHFEIANKLVVEKDIKRLMLLSNIGMSTYSFDVEKAAIGFGAGVGYRVANWLQPVVETSYSAGFNRADNQENVQNITVSGGVVMPIRKNVTLTAGIAQDVAGENNTLDTKGIFKAKVKF